MRIFLFCLTIFLSSTCFAQTEKECLSSSIFYEANNQRIIGQRAVHDVILHRAKASRKSICNVISQPHQFSWYGLKPIKKFDKNMQLLLTNVKKKPSILDEGFQYFYSGKKPKWAEGMECFKLYQHHLCKIVNYKEK